MLNCCLLPFLLLVCVAPDCASIFHVQEMARGGQYRVQKYLGSFLVPIPVSTVLFKNGTEVSVPRYFLKKVFGIFSFLLSLID